MSDSHGHGPSGDDHAEAHAHDDFDPEPAKHMSADETPTSPWVPIVGAGLFLVGTVVFLSRQSDAAPGAGSASAAVSASAAKATISASNKPAAPPTDPAKRQELADQKRRTPRIPSGAPAAGSGAPRPPAAPVVSGRPPVRP